MHFPNDQLNILSHIYCHWISFSVKFLFKNFPPLIFLLGSLSLPLGALYVLYIFLIFVYCWVLVFVCVCLLLHLFVCFVLLCWILVVAHRLLTAECGPLLVVACDLQSAWAQELQHVDLVVLWRVGYYFPDQGWNPCPLQGGRTFNHWSTKEVLLDISIGNFSIHSV